MADAYNRLNGARSVFGVKKPVRAASTGNLTLSGFQTIDGIAYSSGDEAAGKNMRILVKDQTASEQNGIYYVTSSGWARDKDLDGNTDLVKGTIAAVQQGTISAGRLYRVASSDPPDVGTDALTFQRYSLDDFTKNATVASASTIDLTDLDGSVTDGDVVTITGTTTINTITMSAGSTRILYFEDSLTIAASAGVFFGSQTALGDTSITTRPGDFMVLRGFSSSSPRAIAYIRHDGHPLIAQEDTLPSAALLELDGDSSASPNYAQCYKITGTTTINSFSSGSNTPVGAVKILRFESALTVAGITGVGAGLPDGLSISISANDILILRRDSDQTWRVIGHFRADMHPSITGQATVASAATTDLGSVREQCIAVTGVVTITSFGSSAPTGAMKFVTFGSALTLTHNGTSLIVPGGQTLQMQAGDRILARHEGLGNWRVLVVARAEPTIDVTASDASNSTTGEETLHSYTLPQSRLSATGQSLRMRGWGVTAATTVAKRIRMNFGGTVVADTGSVALNGASWELEALVTRTSSSAQRAVGRVISDTTALLASVLISTPAAVLAATAGTSVTLTGLCTTTGGITAKGFATEILTR